MATENVVNKDGKSFKWVFRPYYIHPKTGKKVYPKKAKVFRFLVEIPS